MTAEESSLRAPAKQSRTGAMKQPAVYIMASKRNGTLYTGVTSDLVRRVWQHKEGTIGFTARYGCKLLVWYEIHEEMLPAIAREKQIKAGSRRKKLALIEAVNPDWADLYESIVY
jgi:putative endonuclease